MIFTCDNCKRIDSFRSFYSPKEYGKIVQELNDEIENGKLILIVQSCCLSEVDSLFWMSGMRTGFCADCTDHVSWRLRPF